MRLSSKRAAAIAVLCSGSLIAASCGGSDDDAGGQASYVLENLPDEFQPAERRSSVETRHFRGVIDSRRPRWDLRNLRFPVSLISACL